MQDLTYIKSQLAVYEDRLKNLEAALNIDQQKEKYQELTYISQEDGFWDNQERAIKLQSQLKNIKTNIEDFKSLKAEYEDLLALIELAEESKEADLDNEIDAAVKSFTENYQDMYMQTLFTGEYDQNNAYLSLQAGAGGTEAMDWVSILLRMYQRYAEKKDFKVVVNHIVLSEEAGIKSVSLFIQGDYAYGNLRSEMGVHRLVRISPFDASGRRHTSFASLELVPELDDEIEIDIKPDDLRVDTYHASGAGGQHVNKTSSAVRITHLPTGIVTASQAERSQHQNKDNAMRQLKSKLYALAKSKQKEKIEDLKGEQLDIAWGSQIRSYVFEPYTLVKDHRTNYSETDVESVLDGNIQGFINAYLSDKDLNNNENDK